MITQERLKELFDYDETTGELVWKVKRTGGVKAGDVAGYIKKDGYRNIQVDGKKYLAHRLIWLYVHGYTPENSIDHISRQRHDNRITNLRHVTQSCNLRNTGNRVDNQSGVKGVCWIKAQGKWMAQITVAGKNIHLGCYKTLKAAAKARYDKEQELDWSSCSIIDSPAKEYLQKAA